MCGCYFRRATQARLRVREGPTQQLHEDCHNNSSPDKQNEFAQTHSQGGNAVFNLGFAAKTNEILELHAKFWIGMEHTYTPTDAWLKCV